MIGKVGHFVSSAYRYSSQGRPGSQFNRINGLAPEVVQELNQKLVFLKKQHEILSAKIDAGDDRSYGQLFEVVHAITNIREKLKPKTNW